MKRCSPHFDPSLLQIPAEAQLRLQKSHLGLLKRELDYDKPQNTLARKDYFSVHVFVVLPLFFFPAEKLSFDIMFDRIKGIKRV